MDFTNIENCYKPQPAWLWNSKLNIDNTISTANEITNSGFGGFAVCPFHGLNSTYLGDEWFRNTSAALCCAADASVEGWFFDKAPGHSGYSSKTAHERGLEYQQKFLRCESGEKSNDRTIIFSDGYHFYYDVNPFSLDTLHPSSGEIFTDEYYKNYVSDQFPATGLFLSLSAFPSDSIPWSFSLPAEYKNTYGEELLDVLTELFRPVGNYKDTRFKFWSLISNLYKKFFITPVYNWCKENNIKLTVTSENNNSYDTYSLASSMSLFESCDIPCSEAKSSADISPLKALLASSAMHQYGKKQCGALLYSACGHNLSYSDLRYIAEQYLIRGVNKLIPFAIPYSADGFRKSTVSSSFADCICDSNIAAFNNVLSRISKIMTEGETNFDTLLIHNQTDALHYCDSTENEDVRSAETRFADAVNILEKKHIPFHIGDELVLRDHAHIEGNLFVVGNMKYTTIVLTESPSVSDSTSLLLSEFEMAGGTIVLADSLEDNPITNSEKLLYTTRSFSEYKIHYFLNTSDEYFTASISQGNKMLNLSTGEILPFYGIHKFSPRESIIVIDDSSPQESRPYLKPLKELSAGGIWKIEDSSLNSLIIDRCDVIIDENTVSDNLNAYDVSELVSKLDSPSLVECIYKFNIDEMCGEIFIRDDNFSNFTVKVNENEISCEGFTSKENGKLIDITQYVTEGENLVSLSSKVSANKKLRSLYEKASVYDSEASVFNYERDFSPLVIFGDFGVITNGDFRKLDKKASRYVGTFSLGTKHSECDISSIEKSGFPFFDGSITLKRTFNLSDTSYCIRFSPKAVRSVEIEVNSKIVGSVLWAPYEFDLSEYLTKGDNEIKLTLKSTSRNLSGPHHLPVGETDTVSTSNYYRYSSIWNKDTSPPWQDDFCLVEFGLDIME